MQAFWEKYKQSMFQPVSVNRSKLGADGLQIIVDANEIQKQCIEGLAISWSQTPFVSKARNMERVEKMRKKIETAKNIPLLTQIECPKKDEASNRRSEKWL